MSEDFAFLRQPDGTWVVGQGRSTWRSSRPAGERCFFAPDFFFADSNPWLCFEQVQVWSDDRWRRELHQLQAGPRPRLEFTPPAREPFLARVETLLQTLDLGELSKAVPVEFETGTDTGFDGWSLLPSLTSRSELTPYGFWTQDEAMIGVTPETLLRLQGYQIQTMALAGTAEVSAPSLLQNAKEMHEHGLVIQDIVEKLSKCGTVTVGTTAERELPSLKHLFTPISAQCGTKPDPESLLRRLHPTAALGGFPSKLAWHWLQRQPEAAWRRRFGAPFAAVDDDSLFAIVAIRNLQRHSGRLWLGSGCGIVRGSVPEREWQELALKRSAVRRSLGLS